MASHEAKTCLEWALEVLLVFLLWPVAIKPGEKAPIGESWGLTRPTERSIRETFKRFPKAGVGLLLGPEAGIIDIECDGPEGVDSLAKLFGGEIILTLGWSSARGPHMSSATMLGLLDMARASSSCPSCPAWRSGSGGRGSKFKELPADARRRWQASGVEWQLDRCRLARGRSSGSWMPHWTTPMERCRESGPAIETMDGTATSDVHAYANRRPR